VIARTFIELSAFKIRVDVLGGPLLLKTIQDELLKGLDLGDLVKGSGGIRKLRVARAGSGKSGGYRVFYLDLPQHGITYLMALLDKRDSENISDHEKAILRAFAKAIKGEPK
jgi:hypothetical protein